MPPGGCITSWDPARNRTAVFIAFGEAVPFSSGQFDPANAAGGSRKLLQAGSVWGNFTYQEASAHWCPDAELSVLMLAHHVGVIVSWLLGAGLLGTAAVCGECESLWNPVRRPFPTQHRFYQAIDALSTINADSAEECAQACNAEKQCKRPVVEAL